MTDEAVIVVRCRQCRQSCAKQLTGRTVVLWCLLRNAPAVEPCPGWEREPGTEGDDD